VEHARRVERRETVLKTATTAYRRLAGLAVRLVAVPLVAGAGIAATGRPARMTPAEYRAIMIRGQGVNERYGIGIGTG
jgi:hypothetical protein